MKYSSAVILLWICSLFLGEAYCQEIAIKSNLLYGVGTFTPNLGVEIGLSKRITFDVSLGYNWLNLDGNNNNNKKIVHKIVQPEFRYFLCERFNGHFFGLHGLYSKYNIGGHELPLLFGKGSKDFRHQGDAYGGGISYGYQFLLGKKWNIEFNFGLGYARLKYNKYDCETCGRPIGEESKDYFGPTKAGITLIYLIN